MAGGGGGGGGDDDNPVPVNCVALIDIIFCLCLFFMCALKFKQLEGKIDSWLPKDKGVHGSPVTNPVLEEIRVILKWDNDARRVITKLGARDVENEAALGELLSQSHADFENLGKPDVPVIIDAEPRVPWKAVIGVLNVCKRHNLEKIEFAAPMPPMPGKS